MLRCRAQQVTKDDKEHTVARKKYAHPMIDDDKQQNGASVDAVADEDATTEENASVADIIDVAHDEEIDEAPDTLDDDGGSDDKDHHREAYIAAPEERPRPQSTDEFIVISRVTFNYVVIGATFLVLGIFIGFVVSQRREQARRIDNQQIISNVVAAVLEGQGLAVGESAAPVAAAGGHNAPDQRFTVSVDDDPFQGAEDGVVTIVEFSDYRCPFCGRFARETLHPLLNDYGDNVRFVFRDYPILGNTSLTAAYAAECADDQNAFWQFHDLMFNNQDILGRDTYIQFATDLELDVEQFTTCLDNETHRDEVLADFADAQNLGATGTPTFFINGRLVSGAQPYAVFASVIEEELAELSAQSDADSETHNDGESTSAGDDATS